MIYCYVFLITAGTSFTVKKPSKSKLFVFFGFGIEISTYNWPISLPRLIVAETAAKGMSPARPPRLSSIASRLGPEDPRQAWVRWSFLGIERCPSGRTTWPMSPDCRLFHQLPAQIPAPNPSPNEDRHTGRSSEQPRGRQLLALTTVLQGTAYGARNKHPSCRQRVWLDRTTARYLHNRSTLAWAWHERGAGNREPWRIAPSHRPRPGSVFGLGGSSMRNTHRDQGPPPWPLPLPQNSPVGPSRAPTNPLSPCSCTYMTWMIHLRFCLLVLDLDWFRYGTF